MQKPEKLREVKIQTTYGPERFKTASKGQALHRHRSLISSFFLGKTAKNSFQTQKFISHCSHMLLDFKVGNYRSFRDTAHLNMAASNGLKDDLPQNLLEERLLGLSGHRFLKGVAIYGANASGKSNITRSLFDLQRLVRGSHLKESSSNLPQDPFRLDKSSRNKPTVYEVRFVADKVRYHYAVAFNTEQILEESLSAYPKGREQKWFHRIAIESAESKIYLYEWEVSESFKLTEDQKEATGENKLFFSVAANVFSHKQLKAPYDWFREKLRILNLAQDGSITPNYTHEHLEFNPKKIARMLQHADLGICGASLETLQAPDSLLQQIEKIDEERAAEIKVEGIVKYTFSHRGQAGESYDLDLNEESAGTARYFSLLGNWIDLLEEELVLVVDELETSLHPLLTRELFRLAMTSQKNSQLIVATHDPVLLDLSLLRRDQIHLTEKTAEGDSILYPLNDYKNPPNNREKLWRGYLSGRYGGIPYIPAQLFEEQ